MPLGSSVLLVLSFVFFPPSLFYSILFRSVRVNLSSFRPNSKRVLSRVVDYTSHCLRSFVNDVTFCLLRTRCLLLRKQGLYRCLLSRICLIPLLYPPIFCKCFRRLINNRIPLLVSTLIVGLITRSNSNRHLRIVFYLSVLTRIPRPRRSFLRRIFNVIIALDRPWHVHFRITTRQ